MASHSYLIPDYYPDFHCKEGGCGRTCCSGWRITVSMRKYFYLLGLGCSKDLRNRLDRAFCICDDPSEDRYAQIVPGWDGDCPVHSGNGLCAIQTECGEKVLNEACRYYPRSMRSDYRFECSCANSCEHVVEMLLSHKEPLNFVRKKLSFCCEESEESSRRTETAKQYISVRRTSINILQDRSKSFSERMIKLGSFVKTINTYLPSGIAEAKKLPSSFPDVKYENDDLFAASIIHVLVDWFEEHKPNSPVHEYCAEAENYLSMEGIESPSESEFSESVRRYREAKEKFKKIYPDYYIMTEQIMVNHLFYEGFPFSDKHESMWEEYMSFCAVYAFINLLCICCCSDGDMKKLVDVIAVSFRLIEHSGFDRNAAILLHESNCYTPEKLAAILLL